MSEQNWDNQIGGNHYRTTEGEQHWDMVVRLFGLEAARGYLVGCATKYLLRAHIKEDGKNEIKDIDKAIHYLNKWKSVLENEAKKEHKSIIIKRNLGVIPLLQFDKYYKFNDPDFEGYTYIIKILTTFSQKENKVTYFFIRKNKENEVTNIGTVLESLEKFKHVEIETPNKEEIAVCQTHYYADKSCKQ